MEAFTMVRPLVLIVLLAYSWGCDGQFTMSQPPSVSAAIRETVQITCRRSSGSVDDYLNSWYQQKPGSAPILLIYNDDARASGIPERFSGSIDSSANTATLTISNIQAEDEADYYCLSSDSSGQRVFGGGTALTVTGQPSVPPKVHVFPPSQEEIKSKNKGTLACLMDGFHPGTIQVNWQADGKAISSGMQTTQPTKQGDKYVATSYLTVSPSDWENHQRYSCIVTHNGKTFEEVVKTSACP